MASEQLSPSDLPSSDAPALLTRRSFQAAVISALAYPCLARPAVALARVLLDTSAGHVPRVRVPAAKIAYLMADRSFYSPTLHARTDETHGLVKRFWVEDWHDPSQSFIWPLSVDHAGEYDVTLMLSAPPGSTVVVSGPFGSAHVVCPAAHPQYYGWNWNRITVSQPLALPAGDTTLSIRLLRPANGPRGAALKSIELLNTAERGPTQVRLRKFRSNTDWLNTARFGIMCQCGEWSYLAHGPEPPWPHMADAFDVERYANMVASTGAAYAVWSATWATYYFPAPIAAIDSILTGRTSRRDLIGEIADALAKRHIRLILYYHAGHSDKAWWDKNWVSPDDKTLFFHNWCSIITEVGERYGDRLAGWMFDDELVYYPAPYEQLGAAAKAGSPSRLLSWNPWIAPRGTDFQDFQFGEGFLGSPDLAAENKGIWPDGPMQGLHAHGNFQIDGPNWGITQPDTVIEPPQLTPDKAIQIAVQAAERDEALSWNLLMYADGSVSPGSLRLLQEVGSALRARYPQIPPRT